MKRSCSFAQFCQQRGKSTRYKKQSVSYSVFCRWKKKFDTDCKTMSWLECETTYSGARRNVVKLRCKVCKKFEDKIVGLRNVIGGFQGLRTSNIKNHSRSDQHVHAMLMLCKEQTIAAGLGPRSYAPIAKLL